MLEIIHLWGMAVGRGWLLSWIWYEPHKHLWRFGNDFAVVKTGHAFPNAYMVLQKILGPSFLKSKFLAHLSSVSFLFFFQTPSVHARDNTFMGGWLLAGRGFCRGVRYKPHKYLWRFWEWVCRCLNNSSISECLHCFAKKSKSWDLLSWIQILSPSFFFFFSLLFFTHLVNMLEIIHLWGMAVGRGSLLPGIWYKSHKHLWRFGKRFAVVWTIQAFPNVYMVWQKFNSWDLPSWIQILSPSFFFFLSFLLF